MAHTEGGALGVRPPYHAFIHCAKLIPGHDITYIRNRFSLGAPLRGPAGLNIVIPHNHRNP